MSNNPQCPDCGKALPDFLPGGLCPSCTLGGIIGNEEEFEHQDEAPEIPGFKLHEEVGEGGFGIVYRATQTGTMHRQIALKILKQGVDTRQVLRRFDIERQTLALLEHTNIARIYEAGKTTGGLPYFTMEYVEGQPINYALLGQSTEEILEHFIQVCSAIAYAHTKGVIHRDLKPANILVNHDGVAKVIDFGIAKALDSSETPGPTMYTGVESTLGTSAYMAPEQRDAQVIDLDERVDIYSLGAVLYELIAGVNHHEAHPEGGTISQPSELSLQKVAPNLDHIIMRALAEDREERYQSVGEFTADLRRFLNGDRILKKKTPIQKGKLMTIGAAALLITLAALLLPSRWQNQKEKKPESTEPIEIRHATSGHPHYLIFERSGTKAFAFYRGKGSSVIFDPRTGEKISDIKTDLFYSRSACFSYDGSELLMGYLRGTMQRFDVSTGKQSMGFVETRMTKEDYPCDFVFEFKEKGELRTATISDYKVMAIRERNGTVIRTLPTGHYRSAVSPDQNTTLFGSHEGPVALWTVGAGLKILKGHSERFYEIVSSRNGERFASADHQGTVGVWSKEGQKLQMFSHPAKCFGIALSPDGKTLATGCSDGWVRLFDISSGARLHQLNHIDQTFSLDFTPDGTLLAVGGSGRMVRFWNVETGQQALPSWEQESTVSVVRFWPRKDEGLNLIAMTADHGVVIRSLESLKRR